MPGIYADPMAQHLAGDEDLHCPIFHGLGFLPKRIARPFTFYSRVIGWPFRKKKQTHTKKKKTPPTENLLSNLLSTKRKIF